MYRQWHQLYFKHIDDAVNAAAKSLKEQRLFDNHLELFPSAAGTFPKGKVKIEADRILKPWREEQETKLGPNEIEERDAFVNKTQRKMIRLLRIAEIRSDLREAMKRGKRAPVAYIFANHSYLSHCPRGLRWIVKLRRMISFMMQEFIVPKYSNNIQAFVTFGAAALIVSIGLRSIISEKIPLEVIYVALGLEASLLLVYGMVIFYTDEGSAHSEAASQAQVINAIRSVNTTIEKIATAVTGLNDGALDQTKLKNIKVNLESALETMREIKKTNGQ